MAYDTLWIAWLVQTLLTGQPPVPALDVRPRVGVMSEQVAREKLRAYGLTNIRSFELRDGGFDVQADRNGRPVTLRIDAARGVMRQAGATTPMLPAAGVPVAPRADPREVRRLNDLQRHEERPRLDRTPPHLHVRPEGKPGQ